MAWDGPDHRILVGWYGRIQLSVMLKWYQFYWGFGLYRNKDGTDSIVFQFGPLILDFYVWRTWQ